MIKFNIVTRCTRIKDLATVQASIDIHQGVNKTWHIIFDNAAIESIELSLLRRLQDTGAKLYFSKGGRETMLFPEACDIVRTFDPSYIFFLDDDNTLHPKYFNRVSQVIEENPDKKIIVTEQLVDGKDFTGLKIRPIGPKHTKVQHIDTAQMTIHTSVFDRYSIGKNYTADGDFAEEVFNEHPEWFHYLPEVLSYYNRLS